MEIFIIHHRTIQEPIHKVVDLMKTLATKNDLVWPVGQWPRMKFTTKLEKGASGGHGPIRYTVDEFDSPTYIQFRFTQPQGFNGVHRFELNELGDKETELKHTIEMTTSFSATIKWILAIRWLHDALVEDALDKVENYFDGGKRRTPWNSWVIFLRKLLG